MINSVPHMPDLPRPVEEWCEFQEGWSERAAGGCAHFSVFRFEDLKRDPVAVPVWLLSRLALAALPLPARLWLVAAVCAVLAAADLANRTPHVWRQVPQRFVHQLSPGTLGLVWGFDLGLLVTTQKVVSLLWAGIVAAVLLAPSVAPGLMVLVALLSGLVVVGGTVSGRVQALTSQASRLGRLRYREIRWGSAVILLVLLVATSLQALGG
ncbi:MAG: hypothetical protein V7637_3633 [Mycobacteriales bacterium]|jgi:hypothetical protein